MSADSNTPSVPRIVAAWMLALALTYGFAAFAFASSDWVRGDIAPWIDGVLTVTFLFGFFVVIMGWIGVIWLTTRRWAL